MNKANLIKSIARRTGATECQSKKMLEAFDREQAERLLLLGDILYYGSSCKVSALSLPGIRANGSDVIRVRERPVRSLPAPASSSNQGNCCCSG